MQCKSLQPSDLKRERRKKRVVAKHGKCHDNHVWVWYRAQTCSDGAWRCVACNCKVASLSMPKARQECHGQANLMRALVQQSSHALFVAHFSDGSGCCVFCMRCCAWCCERPRILMSPCSREPGLRAKDRKAILGGKHPRVPGVRLLEPVPLAL